MTESIAPDPISADTLRTLAVAELTTIQNLLVYLDPSGLQFVRNRLHSPDLVRVCDEGPLAETRAVVLDTACGALVACGWAPEQYFLDCGDMFPHAPDTIADDGIALPLQLAMGASVDEPGECELGQAQGAADDLTKPEQEGRNEPGDG